MGETGWWRHIHVPFTPSPAAESCLRSGLHAEGDKTALKQRKCWLWWRDGHHHGPSSACCFFLEMQRKLLGLQEGLRATTNKLSLIYPIPLRATGCFPAVWAEACHHAWCPFSITGYSACLSMSHSWMGSLGERVLKSYFSMPAFEQESFLPGAWLIAFFSKERICKISPSSEGRFIFYSLHHFVLSSGIRRHLACSPFLLFSWSETNIQWHWKLFPRLFFDFWIAEYTTRCLLSLQLIKKSCLVHKLIIWECHNNKLWLLNLFQKWCQDQILRLLSSYWLVARNVTFSVYIENRGSYAALHAAGVSSVTAPPLSLSNISPWVSSSPFCLLKKDMDLS